MPQPRSSLAVLSALTALALTAACQSGHPSSQSEHWVIDSVPGRMVKHFTGYRADRDGRFVDYQYQKKKHISTTLRRHFVNDSPDAPYGAEDASRTKRRPPHSLAPDPLYYMGAESLFIGLASLGINGTFFPLPIESVVATLMWWDGGPSEFVQGFTGGGDEAINPPGVSNFRVKNR
jgi:hypothetical protein